MHGPVRLISTWFAIAKVMKGEHMHTPLQIKHDIGHRGGLIFNFFTRFSYNNQIYNMIYSETYIPAYLYICLLDIYTYSLAAQLQPFAIGNVV